MRLKITLILLSSLFLAFEAQAQCGATFEEQNGIAVLEAETASLPSNWKKETAKTPFTGSSYISWRGSQASRMARHCRDGRGRLPVAFAQLIGIDLL